MNFAERKTLEFIAYEAFIRRAAMIEFPFMLKGSFITRQYFSNPHERIPNDLDWLFLENLADTKHAEQIFNEWAIAVTELEISDGVKFRSFRENVFWRMIDYAMSDDFPTVNTDLKCWVDGVEIEALPIDISFNLPLENIPISLQYKPLRGESFVVPQTVPLSSQVAWKLHQTLVRPRFKDIFDLIHLLKHSDFNENMRRQTLQILVNECYADDVNINNLQFMTKGELGKLFPYDSIKKNWDYWRFRGASFSQNVLYYGKAEHITDTTDLTTDLSEFEEEFKNALIDAGFTFDVLENLPAPTIERKTKDNGRFEPDFKAKSSETSESFFDKIKNWFN